eukprot:gnl/Chilomastix_cuspidata/1802.p1 GENE.gnl/Chilomastix_cuspidata/1802~~gnl/Chilomastix_cuspidata/1802.p1  ORF type:complete len:229 (+),score=42.83 gnl/Chilomastix_cuspidata/1802:45-689(+)
MGKTEKPRRPKSNWDRLKGTICKKPQPSRALPSKKKPKTLERILLPDVFAIDCEMVGAKDSRERDISELARVCIINSLGEVVYDSFVRPLHFVEDFRTKVSGIRPQDISKAPSFDDVQKAVAALIRGKTLVGHAIRNDLRALKLNHPRKLLRDTALYPPYRRRDGRQEALRELARIHLHREIQEAEHSPYNDALASLDLYLRRRIQWEAQLGRR